MQVQKSRSEHGLYLSEDYPTNLDFARMSRVVHGGQPVAHHHESHYHFAEKMEVWRHPGSGKTLVMPVANDALMDRALELGFELQAYSCVSSLDEMAEAPAVGPEGNAGEVEGVEQVEVVAHPALEPEPDPHTRQLPANGAGLREAVMGLGRVTSEARIKIVSAMEHSTMIDGVVCSPLLLWTIADMDSRWKFVANQPEPNPRLHAWKTAHSELTRVYALIKWFHSGKVGPNNMVTACASLVQLPEDGGTPGAVVFAFRDVAFTDWKQAATKQGGHLVVKWGAELHLLNVAAGLVEA